MEVLTTLASAVVAEAIKNFAKDMSSFVTTKVSEYYKNITNKELVDFGWAFEDYLSRTYNEFYMSKSILYTNEATIIKLLLVFIIGLKRYEELSLHEVNDNIEFNSMLNSF